MKRFATRILSAIKRRFKGSVFAFNRFSGRFEEKVFILGDGRSGTTWLMDILNFDSRYRALFEPFDGYHFYPPLKEDVEYFVPTEENKNRLNLMIRTVKRGEYISDIVSYKFPKLFYQGLMIKDITAWLLIDSIQAEFPGMMKVLIIRHPFAVAESKSKKYFWPTRPSYFLEAGGDIENLFADKRTLIEHMEQANDQKLLQVIIWCMVHTIAFQNKSILDYYFLFYENLVSNPGKAVKKLYYGLGLGERFESNKSAISTTFESKSFTTGSADAITASKAGKSVWEKTWSKDQIEEGVEILKAFDLDYIYADEHFPKLSEADLKKKISGDLKKKVTPALSVAG